MKTKFTQIFWNLYRCKEIEPVVLVNVINGIEYVQYDEKDCLHCGVTHVDPEWSVEDIFEALKSYTGLESDTNWLQREEGETDKEIWYLLGEMSDVEERDDQWCELEFGYTGVGIQI